MAVIESRAGRAPFSGSSAGRVAGRLVLVLVGIALPLLGLELALRVLGPILPGSYASALYLEPHPTYGRMNRPSSGGWVRTGEFTTRVDFNAHGLRERELPLAKPSGTERVLVLGDSFVQGAEVPVEATMPRVLERLLNARPGAPVESINAGVGGFGTSEEYLLLQHLGLQYQPDVVVLVFYLGNDVTNNGFRLKGSPSERSKPFFVLESGNRLRQLSFRASRPDELTWKETLRRESLLFGVLDTGLLSKLGGDAERNEGGADRLMRIVIEDQMPVYNPAESAAWRDAWRVTEALLAGARDLAAGAGARLVIVAAPSKWEVDAQAWADLRATYSLSAREWDLDHPRQRLRGIAERNAIEFVDPVPSMRAAIMAGERLYFRDDVHWTAAGHEHTARAIAEHLRPTRGE